MEQESVGVQENVGLGPKWVDTETMLRLFPRGDLPIALWCVMTPVQVDVRKLGELGVRVYCISSKEECKRISRRGRKRWWRYTPGIWLEFADGRIWGLVS